jgi:hypothetical protein
VGKTPFCQSFRSSGRITGKPEVSGNRHHDRQSAPLATDFFRFPARISLVMRRGRRVDPSSFDLTTPCPERGYKIPPNEMMRLDFERMCCPNCKGDVLQPTKRNAASTKRKERR